MGASLWDQVWLPLLIGVAIAVVVAALRRFWNCLMKSIEAVGERAPDHPLLDSGATASADGEPDLERGPAIDPAEGVESVTAPESELVYSGGAPHAQVATDAAGRALELAEMDVPPHSQQEEAAAE